MGDQPITRAEFSVLNVVAKALLDQLTAANVNNHNYNNRNYNNIKNQNRTCEPNRVCGRNNQIIEDSNFSKVEKTDLEEIMSNHRKKLQILREQATSAKSIENDPKALKAKVDEDEVKLEGENLRQQGGLSANTPQAEKHKEVQGISEVSSQTPICDSQMVNSTSITTNHENAKELISSRYPLNPRPKSPSVTDTSSFLFDPFMSVDDETKEWQGADTFDADPISKINTEIDKPTLLDKQIPTKAISVPAQSVLLSFNGLICFDPGGSLSSLFPHVSISLSCPPRVPRPGENHISFDIDTLKSLQTVEPIFNGSDLKANLYSFSMTQNVFQLLEKMPKCCVPVWKDIGRRYKCFELPVLISELNCQHYFLAMGNLFESLSLNTFNVSAQSVSLSSDNHRSFNPDISLLFVFLPISISFPCPLYSMLEESLLVGNKEMDDVVIQSVVLQKDYDTITLSCLNKHCHFYNLKGIEFENILGDSWLNVLERHGYFC